MQSNLKCSQCEFQSMDDKIEKEYIKKIHMKTLYSAPSVRLNTRELKEYLKALWAISILSIVMTS